ncbi:hypothetical protein [Pedobacter roseus]|uniref:O-antigen ligase family protein n=1 Tax=Pedobacter roseus TaxID=336820 RepID=A0A7G9QLP9_9SPHI|nr:hypothetical protein [Pedobacter roseus]QNN44274.1 hypothetical protein H9L23_09460 [Pedobacter roseus]
MPKKILILLLVVVYIYALTFDIFLNNYFKFPAVAVGVAIALLFPARGDLQFIGMRELWLLFLANFFYYVLGQDQIKPLMVNLLIFIGCALYFNFFVGNNPGRLKMSVIVFFSCLALSALVMGADHINPLATIIWRERLIGGEIVQSPSGICTSIFTFGYQVAALSTFAFLYTLFSGKSFIVVMLVLMMAIVPIFYGMQRSALMVFAIGSVLAIVFYFRMKSIPILVGVAVLGLVFFSTISRYNGNAQENILSKAQQNSERGEDRSGLVTENIKIYSDYPLGLLFYNRQWSDVSRHNPIYQGGLTSHNAYLMFITYLGPLVGIILLLSIYWRVGKIFKSVIVDIRNPKSALQAALCFTFLAISLNSLFHNAWLVNANGPTVFLFFCILQLNAINSKKKIYDHPEKENIALSKPRGRMVRAEA